MKKIILTAMFAAAMTLPASAATMFAVNTQFVPTGNNGISTDPLSANSTLTGSETSVTFSSGGNFLMQQCNIASLCGSSPGTDTVTANSGTFDNTSSFTWDGGTLSYQVSTWTLSPAAGGAFTIFTTGTYHSTDANFIDTPGVLNFSLIVPLTDGGFYGFYASGASSPVPEPATMALVGFGLAAVGLYTRRRRKA